MGMMNRSHFSSRLLPYTVTTAGKETVVNSSMFMSSGDAIKSSIRITISVFLVTAAIFGLVGSVLILYFMKTKKVTNSFLRGISFQKNFNFYIKSLTTSDILSSLISVPVTVISLLSDSHSIQSGWGCKATMYFIILFPTITMSNLLVISIEKYLSTRSAPRTLTFSTVKELVLFAWLEGCLIVCFPAATFDGVQYSVNDTHYTVICRYNNHYLPSRLIYSIFVILQIILPMVIMIIINISLIKTVWRRIYRMSVDVQRDNCIKLKVRAAAVRSTNILVAITFAFILPYLFYVCQVIYNNVTKAKLHYETDYVIGAVGATLAMTNPAVNFILYLTQMKDFCAFVKRLFARSPAPNLNQIAMV